MRKRSMRADWYVKRKLILFELGNLFQFMPVYREAGTDTKRTHSPIFQRIHVKFKVQLPFFSLLNKLQVQVVLATERGSWNSNWNSKSQTMTTYLAKHKDVDVAKVHQFAFDISTHDNA
jgi:hypothetical protein